jgi:stage III sporulation protein SpoIIIAA/fructose-specific component phosphotransferase system IIB-like protein
MQTPIENVHILQDQVYEDLSLFLSVLPDTLRAMLEQTGRVEDLLELVLDLGRKPVARFLDGELILHEEGVSSEQIDAIVDNVSPFDDDNRSGIARTLHRISGIRNRRGTVIGLTCRIGRAVYGTVDIMEDIVTAGNSVLLLGAPGVGKTTMLREAARMLAETKRVVIVDTSNEIGGDGDVPHPAVGRARRMQVPKPALQHETMIEAVENHNPEVIVIDEIGREQEATAARTINERGVQLIGTAHGRTLENLLLNPTLSDLVGGIESVTLSDEEARRRGTQKTVLERRAPPTFDVLIEIQERQRLIVHRDVAASVDAMLRGRPVGVELRFRDELGQIQVQNQEVLATTAGVAGRRQDVPDMLSAENRPTRNRRPPARREDELPLPVERQRYTPPTPATNGTEKPPLPRARIFTFGVARNRLQAAARRVGAEVEVVETLDEADFMVTLKTYYRKHRRLISEAEQQLKTVYVLRANTINQLETFLADALGLDAVPSDPFEAAIADANRAIQRVQTGESQVDLAPVGSAMRRYQHQMARQANLTAHSYGKEPERYVRLFNMPVSDGEG